MKLSKIVDAVNAKSFGETNWAYEEIYPYFTQAIAEINGELEAFRQLPLPDDVNESDTFYNIRGYNALSETQIMNYVVTYIVVAMDNAQLANTSRTQTYASQLTKYKEQLISDLYRWMPITTNSNIYFDLEDKHSNVKMPNVGRVWYDESEGGRLSANDDSFGRHQTLPINSVYAENPYGVLVPENPSQKIELGEHYYNYIFIPFEDFRQYYNPALVQVKITGYDIPYTIIHNNGKFVMDIGFYDKENKPLFTYRTDLFKYMWSIMKQSNGKPVTSMPAVMVGSYRDGNTYKTYLFMHSGVYLMAISEHQRYTIVDSNGFVDNLQYLSNNERLKAISTRVYYNNGDTADEPKQEVATLYNINDLQSQINTNETDIEDKLQALKDDLSNGTKDIVPNTTLDTYFPSAITYEED